MNRAKTVVALVFCVSAAANARADPFSVSTTLVTSGVFDCRSTIVCSGEGTNSITFGSGADAATLTFTGVNSTFDVTTTRTQVTFGEFQLDAPDGFTFPTHPANPKQPMLSFLLNIHQAAPVPADSQRRMEFGPEGGPSSRHRR